MGCCQEVIQEGGRGMGKEIRDQSIQNRQQKPKHVVKKIKLEPRQVDGGLWSMGHLHRSKEETELVRWIKEERGKPPNEVLKATRKEYIDAMQRAYLTGKQGR